MHPHLSQSLDGHRAHTAQRAGEPEQEIARSARTDDVAVILNDEGSARPRPRLAHIGRSAAITGPDDVMEGDASGRVRVDCSAHLIRDR
ncbi:hypothetical protein GCM10009810_08640 [Nostocoides vanveenii]|uniref:Uncharacterized protein n=1 Tax=Nostocoides vanveenii TaxID=330835 RepID=A0ABN2K8G7_9MICO